MAKFLFRPVYRLLVLELIEYTSANRTAGVDHFDLVQWSCKLQSVEAATNVQWRVECLHVNVNRGPSLDALAFGNKGVPSRLAVVASEDNGCER